jgi:hypothetical protein
MRALFVSFLVASAALAQDVDPGFSVAINPYVTPFVPLSTEAQAVAEAGAFGRVEDPLRLLDNPAVLADFADGVRVSGHLLTDWFGADIASSGGAVAGGVQTRLGRFPASVGVGLAYGTFSEPAFVLTDEQGRELSEIPESDDEVLALGVGVGIEGPVRVRLGGSLQALRSRQLYANGLSLPITLDDDPFERARATAADVGLDVTLPIGTWLRPAPVASGLGFVLDATVGYALRGIAISGEAPSGYAGNVERRPAAGASLLGAVEIGVGSVVPLRAVEAEFLTGAEDPGADAWGDLSASNVLLGSNPDENAVVHRAVRLTLGEALVLSRGVFEGATFVPRESWGVGFNVGGALRLAGVVLDRPDLHRLGGRFDLRYTYAEYTFDPDGSPFGDTPAHGVVLRVRP